MAFSAFIFNNHFSFVGLPSLIFHFLWFMFYYRSRDLLNRISVFRLFRVDIFFHIYTGLSHTFQPVVWLPLVFEIVNVYIFCIWRLNAFLRLTRTGFLLVFVGIFFCQGLYQYNFVDTYMMLRPNRFTVGELIFYAPAIEI